MRLKACAAALSAALLAAFLYANRDWPRHWSLKRDGAVARGWVIGKSERPRPLVHYAYRGPAKIHTASGEAGGVNPGFDDLAEGDAVTVTFLPSAPDVSILGLPDDRVVEQHGVLMWSLIASLAALVWTFRRELRRQAP